MKTTDTIHIYTDGACSGNPGKGGLGVILYYKGKYKEMTRGYRRTTNNRMELRAVIMALESIKLKNIPIVIYTDSRYVVNAFQLKWLENWIRKDFKNIKNKDLWQYLYRLIHTYENVVFEWVKGHHQNEYNNRCDRLAVTAAKGNDLLEDIGYIEK